MGIGIPWESHANGNKTRNLEWEWEGMGNHLSGTCTPMGINSQIFCCVSLIKLLALSLAVATRQMPNCQCLVCRVCRLPKSNYCAVCIPSTAACMGMGTGAWREWELNRWEWEGMGMLKAIPAHLYSSGNPTTRVVM